MSSITARLAVAVVMIFVLVQFPLYAQDSSATLSGSVADASGKPVPNAKIVGKESTTGQSSEAAADSAGHFSILNLAAGEYEVVASSDGYSTSQKITLTAGAPKA